MIETARLLLREPDRADADLVCAYYVRNASRFERWEPRRSDARDVHERWIDAVRAQRRAVLPATFLAFDRERDANVLVAVVSLSGFSETTAGALLDYSVDAGYEGRGYASEAVAAVLAHAEDAGLRQFTAHYDPANERSGALLQRLGFRIVAQTPGLPGLMRAQVIAMRGGTPVG
jgi:[ribosomal protein S5]-alanine N-acetyltransferase